MPLFALDKRRAAEGTNVPFLIGVDHAAKDKLLNAAEGIDIKQIQIYRILRSVQSGLRKEIFVCGIAFLEGAEFCRRRLFVLIKNKANGIAFFLGYGEAQTADFVQG